MNERGAIAFLVNLFQVNNEGGRIMFGVGQDFCSEQGYDMVRYDLPRLILEVGVVYAEVGVEP